MRHAVRIGLGGVAAATLALSWAPVERLAVRHGWTLGERVTTLAVLASAAAALAALLLRGFSVRAAGRALDRMSGDAFEGWVAAALARQGFEVARTARTRDFGVDVIATSGGVRIGVEAKHQRDAVSSPVVRSVASGCHFHHCAVAAVVTSSRFTRDARRQAAGSALPVVLIDRAALPRMARLLHAAARAAPAVPAVCHDRAGLDAP